MCSHFAFSEIDVFCLWAETRAGDVKFFVFDLCEVRAMGILYVHRACVYADHLSLLEICINFTFYTLSSSLSRMVHVGASQEISRVIEREKSPGVSVSISIAHTTTVLSSAFCICHTQSRLSDRSINCCMVLFVNYNKVKLK